MNWTTRIAIVSAFLLGSHPAIAQQITGTPGSPSATTSISGKQLPPPDPKFGGVIKEGALQSKPWWAPRVVPPKGAPNVLLIITDDAGFGVPSTFGGVPRPDGSGLLAVVCPPLLFWLRPWPTCPSPRAGVGGELRSLSPAGGHGLAEALDFGRPGA